MANCSVCKKRSLLNARFCPYCGAPAGGPEDAAAPVGVPGTGRTTASGTPPDTLRDPPVRTVLVTASALIFLFLGCGAFIVSTGFMVITIAFRDLAVSYFSFLPAPYSGTLFTSSTALILEFMALLLAMLYAVAGGWLWKSSLKGGILGTILVAITFSAALSLLLLAPLWGFSLSWTIGGLLGLWLAVHLQLLLSLLSGWNTLRT